MLVLSCFPGIGLLDMAFESEGFCVVRGPDVIWGGDIRRFHPPAGRFDGVIGGPPCQSFSSLAHLVRANGHEPRFGNLIPEFERCVTEAQPAWFLMENVRAAPEPVVAGYGVTCFLLDNAHLDSGDGHGQEQTRLRKFCFGMRGVERPPDLRRWIDLATFLLPDPSRTVTKLGPDHLQNLADSSARIVKQRRQAVVASTEAVPVKIGGSGKVKRTAVCGAKGPTPSSRDKNPVKGVNGAYSTRLADACRLQGLPDDWTEAFCSKDVPLTAEGKLKAVANGVCLHTGRQIARAIKEAINGTEA